MIGKNNPFNIRYNHLIKWKGLEGQTKGFCNFESLEYGVRAASIIVFRSYYNKNVRTVSEIINRFAPASENDTQLYIEYVCKKCDMFPFDIPYKWKRVKLLSAMSHFEGNPVDQSLIVRVLISNKLYFNYENFC